MFRNFFVVLLVSLVMAVPAMAKTVTLQSRIDKPVVFKTASGKMINLPAKGKVDVPEQEIKSQEITKLINQRVLEISQPAPSKTESPKEDAKGRRPAK